MADMEEETVLDNIAWRDREKENTNLQMGTRESASMFKGHNAYTCTIHDNCTIVDGEHKQNPPNPLKDWTENQVEKSEGMPTVVQVFPVHQPILAVIDDEIALEALNNNILILEDAFRTGFECKACDGEGHTKQLCTTCGGNKVVAQNPDFNATAATLTESDKKALPPHFIAMLERKNKEQVEEKIVSGGLIPCSKCQVSDKRGGTIISGFQQCTLCKGFGASMVVPEDSMRRPTSGKVVSLGPLCKFLKPNDHVVYSNMMGHATKFKGKDVLRVMREDEIMMRIHGTKPENFQRKVTS